MERAELSQQWERYCDAFFKRSAESYSLEDSVFDASKFDIPEELMNKARNSDVFQSIRFSGNAMKNLGTLECSDERIKEMTRFLQRGDVQLALGYKLGKSDTFHVLTDAAALSANDIWFIGDVHGDLLALRSALAFINSNSSRPPIYVFMGDMFDRNPLGMNVLLDVVGLIKSCPGQVLWLVGNHDDAISCDDNGVFSSSVTPKQFTDYLNEIDNTVVTEFIRTVIGLVKQLPTGLVLPNGLLATHGGIPSRKERSVKNIWENISVDDMEKYLADCRKELLMNRFAPDTLAGTKMGSEFSWLELVNFSAAIERKYGVRIRAYLRGHDHCDLCRHEWAAINPKLNLSPDQQDHLQDVLTMTTMVRMDEAEKTLPGFFQHRTSYPSVAKVVPSKAAPQCYSLVFEDGEVAEFYAQARRVYSRQTALWLGDKLVRLRRKEEEAKDAEDKAYEEAMASDNVRKVAKKRMNEATAALRTANDAVMAMKTEVDTSKAKVDDDQRRLAQNEGATTDKMNEKRIQEGELSRVKDDLDNYKQTWPRDKKQFENQLEELKGVEHKIVGINRKMIEVDNQRNQSRESNEKRKLDVILRDLMNEKQDIERRNPRYKERITQLEQKLDAYSEENVNRMLKEGEGIVSELQGKIYNLESELKSLKAEKTQLCERLEKSQKEWSAAKKRLEQAEDQQKLAQRQYNEAADAVKEAEYDYSAKFNKDTQCAQILTQASQLVAECEAKQKKFQELARA